MKQQCSRGKLLFKERYVGSILWCIVMYLNAARIEAIKYLLVRRHDHKSVFKNTAIETIPNWRKTFPRSRRRRRRSFLIVSPSASARTAPVPPPANVVGKTIRSATRRWRSRNKLLFNVHNNRPPVPTRPAVPLLHNPPHALTDARLSILGNECDWMGSGRALQ